MKKYLLVVLVIAFFFSAKAQQSRIDIGVEAGLSLMGVQITPKYDAFRATMFESNGGVTLLYSLTENFAFRTGLLYSSDSGSYMKSNYDADENYTITTYAAYRGKSINVPLAVRGSYGRRFRVFLEAGMMLGYEYNSIVKKYSYLQYDNPDGYSIYNSNYNLFTTLKYPFFRTLLDLRAGFNFHLSKRLMLEAGAGLYMTTRPLDLSVDPDFISGKMEVPVHLSLYYKI